MARSAKQQQGDDAEDGNMQRTSTAFKNRSGFRGVRRVCWGLSAQSARGMGKGREGGFACHQS